MRRVARRLRQRKMYGGSEKRKHPRITLATSVSYKVKKIPPPEKLIRLLDSLREGPTVDVSHGGLSFVSRQLLIPGSIIDLKIPKSPLARAQRRRARVVWLNEIERDKYRIGVKFL